MQESNHSKVIKKIELAFGRYRRSNDGKRYPAKLKRMALAAVDDGIAGRTVAMAAGVTPKSLRNWRTRDGIVPPKELRLVPCAESSGSVSSIAAAHMARVTLPSGVAIEFPTSALTTTLIAALNGGGI